MDPICISGSLGRCHCPAVAPRPSMEIQLSCHPYEFRRIFYSRQVIDPESNRDVIDFELGRIAFCCRPNVAVCGPSEQLIILRKCEPPPHRPVSWQNQILLTRNLRVLRVFASFVSLFYRVIRRGSDLSDYSSFARASSYRHGTGTRSCSFTRACLSPA